MIYPLIGTVSGAFCFYIGMQTGRQQQQKLQTSIVQPLRNTFRDQTISDYVQRRRQPNRYILYSKHHKCALATHQLIDPQSIRKELITTSIATQPSQGETTVKVTVADKQQQVISSPVSQKGSQITTSNNQNETRPNLEKQSTTERLIPKLFNSYAKSLIAGDVCQSVELISGPVFSKDTPYKQGKQVIKNVFTSVVHITPDGRHQTDRNYTIVVCNSTQGHFFNAFTHRRPSNKNFKLINYLTSLKKLEEQTGLAFNLEGRQLTEIDYAGLSKQRTFEEAAANTEAPSVEQKKE